MFNLSGTEVVFLLVAGLVVLGPERLPGVIRSVGRLYADFRRAAQGVERELRETLGEPIGEITSTARGIVRDVDSARHLFGTVDHEPSPPMRPERSAPSSETPDPAAGAHEDVQDRDPAGPGNGVSP